MRAQCCKEEYLITSMGQAPVMQHAWEFAGFDTACLGLEFVSIFACFSMEKRGFLSFLRKPLSCMGEVFCL